MVAGPGEEGTDTGHQGHPSVVRFPTSPPPPSLAAAPQLRWAGGPGEGRGQEQEQPLC